MFNKIKSIFLSDYKLARHYEKTGELNKAFKEYERINDYKKAGKILEKMGSWHKAASNYIVNNEIDLARRSIDNCFKKGKLWESFKLKNGKNIKIEDWLKDNDQTRRFVRYVHNVKILDSKGIPIIISLADKLNTIKEYKNAAQLYNKGFYLVNKDIKSKKSIKNETWLLNAAECYSKIGLYSDAASCMKELMVTEVEIGMDISKNYKYNPYRNYTVNLEKARNLNILPELVSILEDFDPFNISYDLLRMKEIELSMEHFFKYFGRVVKKNLTEKEIEIRNEKISYCFNQYIMYHRERKEYLKAAKIALLNSQKKMAADLYKLALESNEKPDEKEKITAESIKMKGTKELKKKIDPVKKLKCDVCGESVEEGWDICPNCENSLVLNMCDCGLKIKPYWQVCPECGRKLD
ncbi:MAG: zinc ribbon domain-containing protein [Acidobacteriota bacterium]